MSTMIGAALALGGLWFCIAFPGLALALALFSLLLFTIAAAIFAPAPRRKSRHRDCLAPLLVGLVLGSWWADDDCD